MKRKCFLLSLCWLLCTTSSNSVFAQLSGNLLFNAPLVNNPVSKPGYTLIWNDEFNTLSIYDGANTSYNWRTNNGVVNYPLEMGKLAMSIRPENLDVASGYLNIVTRKEDSSYVHPWIWQDPVPTGHHFDVTSAQIQTQIDFKYGYIEGRCKVPHGAQLWPAFWMFGSDVSNYANEADIFELSPTSYAGINRLGANIHWGYPSNSPSPYYGLSTCIENSITGCTEYYGGTRMDPYEVTGDLMADYYTFAMEWTPTELKFYLNNVLYYTATGNAATAMTKRMVVILNTHVYNIDSTIPWSEILGVLEPSSTFSVDYVRVYKKNPVITPSNANCASGTLSCTATTGIPGDTYAWSFSPTAAVTSVSTSTSGNNSTVTFQILPAYQNTSVTVTVTATGAKSYEVSSESIQVPDLNTDFTVGAIVCARVVPPFGPYSIQVPVMAAISNTSSQWDIYSANSSGTITNPTAIQTGTGSSFTFNTGLAMNGYYVIKHSEWKTTCVPLTTKSKLIQIGGLNDFTVGIPTCTTSGVSPGISITATPLTTMGTNQWDIYACDASGTISGSSLSTKTTSTATFTGLVPNSYYKIKHTVSGTCVSSAQDIYKVVYIPTFTLEPKCGISGTITSSGTISYTATPDPNNYSFNNFWEIWSSDITGVSITKIGSTQWGTTATFSGLNPNNYYVIKHGVWNACTDWNEKDYKVIGTTNVLLRTNGTVPKAAQVEEVPVDMNQDYINTMREIVAEYERGTMEAGSAIVYPNPTTGSFTVHTNDNGSKTIEVRDVLGSLVLKKEYEGMDNNIALPASCKGVYVITIKTDLGNTNQRLVVE